MNIKSRVDENKYSLDEIKPLYTDEGGLLVNNRLQQFINKVVKYAEYKQGIQESSQITWSKQPPRAAAPLTTSSSYTAKNSTTVIASVSLLSESNNDTSSCYSNNS